MPEIINGPQDVVTLLPLGTATARTKWEFFKGFNLVKELLSCVLEKIRDISADA